MTSDVKDTGITDEMLVAYLDGELTPSDRSAVEGALEEDAQMSERLNLLRDGERPWESAFEKLLEQAPTAKLEAGLAAAMRASEETVTAPAAVELDQPLLANDQPRQGWWRPAMAACVAVTLMIGFAAGYGTNEVQKTQLASGLDTEAEVWRQAVADYQALYTRETLSTSLTDPIVQSAGLLRVAEALGLALPDAVSQVRGLDYKRAQILKFGEQPLAQLAYLYKDDIPIAFCIVRLDEADRAAKNEVRSGLNIVHWAKGGYSLMLVGDLPVDELNDFARDLEGKMI